MDNTIVPEVTKAKKTSKPLLTILLILLPLLLLISLFFLFKSDINDFISNTKDSICKEETEIEEEKTEETGNTVQNPDVQEDKEKIVIKDGELYTIETTLPEGWSLKLAYDGDNSNSLVGGVSYSGLTGIEVKKGVNIVFTMNAVSGIGMSSCETYYTFEDSPALDLVAIEEEIGYAPTVIDLSKITFTQVNLLGNSFRRIGSTYYQNVGTSSNKFEVSCYLGLTSFKNLFVKTSDDEDVNSYIFKVTPGTSETDLKILDSILDNVELVYYE